MAETTDDDYLPRFPCEWCGKIIDPDICKGTGLCDRCKDLNGMDRMGNKLYFNEDDDQYADDLSEEWGRQRDGR